MPLSRATDQAELTGALLLPVEAVASDEPTKTLARDYEQYPADGTATARASSPELGLTRPWRSRRPRQSPGNRATEPLVIAIAREANARPLARSPAGCKWSAGVRMTGWSQVR